MLMLLLLVLGMVSGEALVEDEAGCRERILDFSSCMAAAGETAKAAWNRTQASIHACFTEQGCEDPAVRKAEYKACRDGVLEAEVAPLLRACAASKDVTLSEHFLHYIFSAHHHNHHHGHHAHHKEGKSWWVARKVVELCGNLSAEEQSVVQECVLTAKAQASKAIWQDKHRAFAACFQELSGCEEEWAAGRAALCECGKSLSGDEELVERTDAGLASCHEGAPHDLRDHIRQLLLRLCWHGHHGHEAKEEEKTVKNYEVVEDEKAKSPVVIDTSSEEA